MGSRNRISNQWVILDVNIGKKHELQVQEDTCLSGIRQCSVSPSGFCICAKTHTRMHTVHTYTTNAHKEVVWWHTPFYNPSTWKVEERGTGVQGHPLAHDEFETHRHMSCFDSTQWESLGLHTAPPRICSIHPLPSPKPLLAAKACSNLVWPQASIAFSVARHRQVSLGAVLSLL